MDVIFIVNIFFSLIGMIAAILLIIVYILRKQWSLMMTLNFQLGISLLFHNCPFFVPLFGEIISESEKEFINSSGCKFLRSLHTTALSSCLLIITIINVIALLIFKSPSFLQKKGNLLQQIITIFIWVFNILTFILFLNQEQNEISHNICRTSLHERLTQFYFYICISLLVISIISFIVIKGNINELLKEEIDDENIKKKYKLQKYIWCFGQLLMIANFAIYGLKQQFEEYYNTLFYIDQLLEIISLILLLFVYAFTKVVLEEIRERLCCGKEQANKDQMMSFDVIRITEDYNNSVLNSN